jgi:hypothetical protein
LSWGSGRHQRNANEASLGQSFSILCSTIHGTGLLMLVT